MAYLRTSAPLSKVLVWVLRLALGLAILAYFAIGGYFPIDKLRAVSPKTLVVSVIISGTMVYVIGVRLSLLLAAQNVSLKFSRAFLYSCLGLLTSIAIPSSLSGDVVKGLALAKQNRTKKTSVWFTIVLDRMIGILGLGIVASFFIVTSLVSSSWATNPVLHAKTTILLMISLVITFSAFALIMFCLFSKPWEWRCFSLLFSKFKKRFDVENLVSTIARSRNSYRTLLVALGLSIINHLLRTSIFQIICNDFEIGISFIQTGSIICLASFVNAIPFSPGNFGTGDALFGFIFSYMGQQYGVMVSVLARVIIYAPAIIALYYLKNIRLTPNRDPR